MTNPTQKRWDITTLSFLWKLGHATVQDDILTWAAVIAFYGLFSLFPLLMVMLYVAALLLPGSHMEHLLVLVVKPYFPALSKAQEFISLNIDRMAATGAKVGIVSLLTLTWSACSGFIALQQALDVIWNVHQQRSYLGRRIMACGMLLVLLLLTLGSAVVMALYSTASPNTGGVGELVAVWFHHLRWLHGASRILFPGSLLLGCVVIYRFMPTRSTSWAYMLPGAVVATLGLDLGRELFVWYAEHMATYQLLYGGLFAVMLVILWLYIGSATVLFGAEINATLEHWAVSRGNVAIDDKTPPLDPL